jgi:glucose-6-phosphate isomerase
MPRRPADLDAAAMTAAGMLERCAVLCVIGIGGSSLGARALTTLKPDPAVAVDFLENVDADDAWRRFIAPETGFLVVSKSGTTAETLANFLTVWREVAALMPAPAAASRFVALTQPGDSPLRRLADQLGIPVIDHDPDLAGRYSALSPVGLLPAHAAGLDTGALHAAADDGLAAFEAGESAPETGAAIQVGLARDRGATATVMMPYIDRLEPFARWYGQIWGESVGKDGHGTMPYPALGAIDQHSQLQLWLDGPADKLFTLIAPVAALDSAAEPPIDTLGDPGLGYLEGRSRGDLLRAEYRATAQTLAGHGRPVRTITPAPGAPLEAVVGALMMHFMIETAVAGYMLGIDPFSQPAVDEGKALARQFLSDSS